MMAAALMDAEPHSLPSGWRWEQLSCVCDKPERGTPASRFDKVFRYTDVGGVGEGVVAREIAVSEAPSRARQFVLPGDTLLSCVRVNLRRGVLVKENETDVASTAFSVLRPRSGKVHPRYLYYWTTAEPFVKALLPLQRGNQPPAVVDDDVRAQLIPLPPLESQQRIADRIEELFIELDDGEEELRRARAELETYRKSLLKAAVTGELTADWRAANPPKESSADLLARILADRGARSEADPKSRGKRYKEPPGPQVEDLPVIPENWAWATFPQLGDFGRGKSKHRPRDDARLYGGPYPFVQTGVVAGSRGRIVSYNQTYTEFGVAQSKLWPTGTLCITIAANIAKSGVLQFEACFPDSVVGLTTVDGVHPAYIELVVRSLQAKLEKDAPATAQKNINLETLSYLPIPLPPSCEQLAIIEAFEDFEAAGDLILRPDLDADAATLRQSILAAAFRGELVQ